MERIVFPEPQADGTIRRARLGNELWRYPGTVVVKAKYGRTSASGTLLRQRIEDNSLAFLDAIQIA
jgi:hypothetical protein